MAFAKDITGQTFGQLTAVEIVGRSPVVWLCACACGKTSTVRTSNLTSGNSTSCGKCRSGDECILDGCDKPRYQQRVLCATHAMRKWRYGDPLHEPVIRVAIPGYRAVHRRLAVDRGVAREHDCIDCAGQAEHWSYDHLDPSPLYSRLGVPYSVDPARYQPRCIPCHRRFDAESEAA